MGYTRGQDGLYHIKGKKYSVLEGSRAQVYHKNAYKTTGGLTKSMLFKNKRGEIVSLKKHKSAKKDKRLEKAGYFTKKGKFGYVRKNATKKNKKSMKKRGGGCDLTPFGAGSTSN
jgi:hypothetical protein|tara:strand:- start:177 stop:521 length:345 start_codon:yes stop_codon:yes gene_type:complete